MGQNTSEKNNGFNSDFNLNQKCVTCVIKVVGLKKTCNINTTMMIKYKFSIILMNSGS
jgi:hypothetical protein